MSLLPIGRVDDEDEQSSTAAAVGMHKRGRVEGPRLEMAHMKRFYAAYAFLEQCQGSFSNAWWFYTKLNQIPNPIVRILARHKHNEAVDTDLGFVEDFVANHLGCIDPCMRVEIFDRALNHHSFDGQNPLGAACEEGVRRFLYELP